LFKTESNCVLKRGKSVIQIDAERETESLEQEEGGAAFSERSLRKKKRPVRCHKKGKKSSGCGKERKTREGAPS